MTYLEAVIIAIIEGVTEFLPISSTGHMIIASSFMGIAKDDFTKLFEVAIQLGAICSVVILFRGKFFPLNRWHFYLKLIIAVLPALILGALFSDAIDDLLESPMVVSITMVLGGVALIFIDSFFKNPTISVDEQVTNKKAFIIGFWQCVAMIPGVSRSAASIIGGMQQGLTRKLAGDIFSLLGVTKIAAATGYK